MFALICSHALVHMIHDDTHLNRIDFAGHLRTLSSMSSYVCKVLQNCEACPAYGVTPLHLRTEIGVCTAPVLCGTYKNSKCFNEQLCRQSLNATPSIVHCECRKDHYYDDATRQCQNANKDSVVAHILYWLVFLPIAFAGLVIATRLYRKKLLGFEKRNKEGNRRPSSFKSGIKHYCCANKAVLIGVLTILYSLRRIFFCVFIDELYFSSFLRRILSIIWLSPCLAGVLYMEVHLGILGSLKSGQKDSKQTYSKLVVAFFIVTIILCFIFQVFHIFSIFMNLDEVTKNELNRVFEKYIMQYVMVFYSVSAVGVVAYIFFKTSAIMKSLYKQADRINTLGTRKAAANQGRTILKNIERLHVTSLWIGILILWVICLGFAIIIDGEIHTSLYSDHFFFFVYTCLDTLWIIITSRALEGTPKSDILPCLSRFRCVEFVWLKTYREKLSSKRNLFEKSDERIGTSITELSTIELSTIDSSEQNRNSWELSKAAAKNPLSSIS